MSLQLLRNRMSSGEIRHIDYYFAKSIKSRYPQTSDELLTLFCLLSQTLGNQNTILDIEQCLNEDISIDKSNRDKIFNELEKHPFVGQPGSNFPIILNKKYLQFQRYYGYENFVAQDLIQRNQLAPANDSSELKKLFNETCHSLDDSQKTAVAVALTRRLCVITGGPGSGKTTTIVKIASLYCLSHCKDQKKNLNIRLAAPTGKAAKRLSEALDAEKPDRSLADYKISTLHRLLGMSMDGRRFRYDSDRMLEVDLLIVDEVSMIDLPMMTRLLKALPSTATLVLVGDADQLPSVDVGNVLADIQTSPSFDTDNCNLIEAITGVKLMPHEKVAHCLSNASCHLQNSFRFDSKEDIGVLAKAIQGKDYKKLEKIFLQNNLKQVLFAPAHTIFTSSGTRNFVSLYDAFLDECQEPGDPLNMLEAFEKVRILSITREGEKGVENLNNHIENHLDSMGFLATKRTYYHGRPIMITRNDYRLDLFNGDVGICYQEPGDTLVKAVFKDTDGTGRTFLTSSLPDHETCFSMTVHKSQGSEYDHVALVLSEESSDQVRDLMNRETLYTAVTRCRRNLTIYSEGDNFIKALKRSVSRKGGLSEMF